MLLLIGGYNKSNAAKLWTAITATVLKCPVSGEIPEHQVCGSVGMSLDGA